MKIDVVRQEGTVIVTVSGRLSSAVADQFQDRLMAELDDKPTALVMDFAELKFITSAGLRTLIVAAKQARSDGYHVHLCGMTDSIREVFDVSGLLRIFIVHPSLAAGLAAAQNASAPVVQNHSRTI
jgi:anti-anti-sigma factor